MVLNEELHAKYPLDLAQEVLDKLAGRSDCTLGRVQRDVIGPVPTDRDSYDPSHILGHVPGGDQILVLDSQKLPPSWSEEDLAKKIMDLRRPRHDTGGSESEGSAASSVGSDLGSQVTSLIYYDKMIKRSN